MDSIDIKTLKVNDFHKEYCKRISGYKFPIFSVIELNLHGSCNRRCAFCTRVDIDTNINNLNSNLTNLIKNCVNFTGILIFNSLEGFFGKKTNYF